MKTFGNNITILYYEKTPSTAFEDFCPVTSLILKTSITTVITNDII